MTDAINRLLADTGLDPEALGNNVERAVATRIVSSGVRDIPAYLDLVRSSQSELNLLIQELSVIETWFFRDRGPFEFLAEYAHGRDHLRVLSAGCATGEEPYSIAITLIEAGLSPDDFDVHASDINEGALKDAVRATYGAHSFRETWRDARDRWFYPVQGGHELRPEIVRAVQFRHEDLLHPSFLLLEPPYDIVFCRNVLIYLRPEAQAAALEQIGSVLESGGITVVGHAEVGILLRHGYEAVSKPQCFACRRKAAESTSASVDRTPAASPVANALPVAAFMLGPNDVPGSEGILELARRLADAGDFEGAWAICEWVLTESPVAEAHYLEGLISAASNRCAAAEESFRKALYLEPTHYEALVQMSLLCHCRGDSRSGDRFRQRAQAAAHRKEATHARRP